MNKQKRGRLSTIGLILLCVSMVLLMTALGFMSYNHQEDRKAAEQAEEILEDWIEMPLKTDTDGDLVRGLDSEPEYLAILKIPTLDLTLPVNTNWSEEASEKSPCRYRGSIAGSDLIIAGHNYNSHFGSLKNLQPGDSLYLIDAAEKKHYYEVVSTEIVSGTDADQMESGEWDLTLFTCDYMGTNRVTVRCQKVEAEPTI